jgi:hypothetical protein
MGNGKRVPGGGAGKEEEGEARVFPRIRWVLAKRRRRFGVGVLCDVCRKESRLQREGKKTIKRIDGPLRVMKKMGFTMRFGHGRAAPVGKRKIKEKEKRFLTNFYLIFNKYPNKFQSLQNALFC